MNHYFINFRFTTFLDTSSISISFLDIMIWLIENAVPAKWFVYARTRKVASDYLTLFLWYVYILTIRPLSLHRHRLHIGLEARDIISSDLGVKSLFPKVYSKYSPVFTTCWSQLALIWQKKWQMIPTITICMYVHVCLLTKSHDWKNTKIIKYLITKQE